MTTTGNTIQSLTIIECPIHGSKATADLSSAAIYVGAAWMCDQDRRDAPAAHAQWHEDDGTYCWTECDQCVIDPFGLFD